MKSSSMKHSESSSEGVERLPPERLQKPKKEGKEMIVLVDAESGVYMEHGDADRADRIMNKILSYHTGRHVIILAPSTDGVLEDYVDYADGEDCWAGIKYIPETGKFQVELVSDSNSELDPVYQYDNYFDAVSKARELVD